MEAESSWSNLFPQRPTSEHRDQVFNEWALGDTLYTDHDNSHIGLGPSYLYLTASITTKSKSSHIQSPWD